MIHRVELKARAKQYLAANGNQSGMAGVTIFYSVITNITVAALSGVFLALSFYGFWGGFLSGLLSVWLGMAFTVIITVISQILQAAINDPFTVGLHRYYLHVRKNGTRTSVLKLFDGFDYFLEFASVGATKELSIQWLPAAIEVAALVLSAIIVWVCGGIGGAFHGWRGTLRGTGVGSVFATLLLVAAFIAAIVIQVYRSLQFWAVEWIQADYPELKAQQVLEYSQRLTNSHIGDLLVYELSFLGWNLLSLVTGGIAGIVYVEPYYRMTSALLYEELKGGAIELRDIPGNSGMENIRPPKIIRQYNPGSSNGAPTGAQPGIMGVAGMYAGSNFPMRPDQTLTLGRDSTYAQIVFSQGADKISRRHCSVMFNGQLQQYQVVDYSSNGTYARGSRLPINTPVMLPRGTDVALGDMNNVIRLI